MHLCGGKSAVLFLIFAKEATNGQQYKRCDSDIIGRQSIRPHILREQLPDNSGIQQDIDQKPIAAHDKRTKNCRPQGHTTLRAFLIAKITKKWEKLFKKVLAY